MTMSTDLTGSFYGKLRVLSRHSAANKKVRWNVECLSCYKIYDISTDSLKKNSTGCTQCARDTQAKGINSAYWRGGKYISASFLSNVKRGAKKRNISCEITIDDLDKLWLQQDGKCVYTGKQLELGRTASLDRINSSIGYKSNNIQFVDKMINTMKWDFTEIDFLRMIAQVYEYKNLRKEVVNDNGV